MNRIIQISGDKICIGMSDSSIIEVYSSNCNFSPNVGDEVEVYYNENKTIVHKVDKIYNHTNQHYQTEYVSHGNVVNKIVYLLLAFFVGGFGFHKFYSGKIGTGILYLMFCWTFIPGFVAFIEFIIACFKEPDSHGNIVV